MIANPPAETAPETSPISVRLEPELADFVRQIAEATCNTASGALRLCVRTVKVHGLPLPPPFQANLAAATPEMALAH